MIKVGAIVEVLIRRDRIKFSFVFVWFKFKFAHLVTVVPDGKLTALDEAAELAQAALDFKALPALFQILKVYFIRRHGNSVAATIVGVAEVDPTFAIEPT